MNAIQTIATTLTAVDQRPRCHGPRSSRPGAARAQRQDDRQPVRDVEADRADRHDHAVGAAPQREHERGRHADPDRDRRRAMAIADTRASHDDTGAPPSRAKANSMREFDVTDDSPQNHMAPITIHTSAPPSRAPSAVAHDDDERVGRAWPSRRGRRSPASSTSSITNPTTPETQTALHDPARRAPPARPRSPRPRAPRRRSR